MWVKEHPKKEGHYWVNMIDPESGEEGFEVVYYIDEGYYKNKVLSFDGERYSPDCGLFIEWWDKKIQEPPENGFSRKLYTSGGVVECLKEKGYKGDSFEGAVGFAISLGLNVGISSNGYIVESKGDNE